MDRVQKKNKIIVPRVVIENTEILKGEKWEKRERKLPNKYIYFKLSMLTCMPLQKKKCPSKKSSKMNENNISTLRHITGDFKTPGV